MWLSPDGFVARLGQSRERCASLPPDDSELGEGDDVDEVARKTELGEPIYLGGLIMLSAGAVTALVGGVALGLGLAE